MIDVPLAKAHDFSQLLKEVADDLNATLKDLGMGKLCEYAPQRFHTHGQANDAGPNPKGEQLAKSPLANASTKLARMALFKPRAT